MSIKYEPASEPHWQTGSSRPQWRSTTRQWTPTPTTRASAPTSSSPRAAPARCSSNGTIREQLPLRNVKRFRGGLVFKAHRLCVSLNSRLESNKEEEEVPSGRTRFLSRICTKIAARFEHLCGDFRCQQLNRKPRVFFFFITLKPSVECYESL